MYDFCHNVLDKHAYALHNKYIIKALMYSFGLKNLRRYNTSAKQKTICDLLKFRSIVKRFVKPQPVASRCFCQRAAHKICCKCLCIINSLRPLE